MSKLPEVSTEKIYQRLSSNLSSKQTETLYQLAHLELLAEALRDERDALERKVSQLESELDSSRELSSGEVDQPEN